MIDASDFVNKLEKLVKYCNGFIDSIRGGHIQFMNALAEACVQALYSYIDNKARLSPSRLHHVYEQGQAGNPNKRLYEFTTVVSADTIRIIGRFLDAEETTSISGVPFVKRAEIMEAGTEITITPRPGGVLAFEDGNETVFTSTSVTVTHPGGPEVEGAFGDAVYAFFKSYINKAILMPLMGRLGDMRAFEKNLRSGVSIGYTAGTRAGTEYWEAAKNELI